MFNTNIQKLKTSTVILLLIFISASLSAQIGGDGAPAARERLFFGGNFGLQFGSVTDIELSPVVGFWVLPRIAVAAGPDYRFYSFYKNRTHIYGGKSYLELTLLRNINSVIPIGANTDIIGHIEDQYLSLESDFFSDPPHDTKRFGINTVLAGGGLSQQIGKRSSLNIMVLWAVDVKNDYGLYSNPEFRISFMF